jgi:tetratricopeptide (TPR) repeat protein
LIGFVGSASIRNHAGCGARNPAMKSCPICNTQYPDQFTFCQRDGQRLSAEPPPPPPSFTTNPVQPIAPAAPLAQTTNRIEVATQPVQPAITANQAPMPVVRVEPARLRAASPAYRRTLLWLGLCVLLVCAAAAAYYFYANSTQNRFAAAIKQGNLVTPAGASAYDLYLQLRREGKTAEELVALTTPLLPQLTAKPQQLLADITVPGRRDTTPEAWEEAQRMLAWASDINPKDNKLAAQATYAAGRAAYLRGKKDDALDLWKKAFEQDRSWFLPANGLGLLYNERKNLKAALQYLNEASRREPNSALPYNNLGTAYLLAKDDLQAESYYRKAIGLAPNWPRPHAWLGEIAMRRKDYAQAVHEFELVLSLGATTDTTIDANKIRQQLEQARKRLQEQSAPPAEPVAPLPNP